MLLESVEHGAVASLSDVTFHTKRDMLRKQVKVAVIMDRGGTMGHHNGGNK